MRNPKELLRSAGISLREGWRKDPFLVAGFAVAALANLLPLMVTRYVPFTDISGHMGLVGAIIHRNDAAARIHDYFTIDFRLLPYVLYYSFLWILSPIIDLPEGTNIFLGLFSVIGVPASLAYALKSFGRDPRLALLSFPFVYHRAIWFGFASFISAIPITLVGLALLNRLLQTPTGWRQDWGKVAWLALLGALAVAGHPFTAMVFFGLWLVLVATSSPSLPMLVKSLSGLIPGLGYIAWWKTHNRLDSAGGNSLLKEILGSSKSLKLNYELFQDWTLHGFRNGIDRWIMLAALAGILLALVWTVVHRSPEPQARNIFWKWRPVILLLIVFHMFLMLPMELANPPWWAVCVRLVPFVWFFGILALPHTGRKTPAWAIAPALCAGIFYGGYLAYDFRTWFHNVEMAGFDQALDDIPKGVKVHAIWPDFNSESHYKHFPFAHFGTFYTARRGGLATPLVDGSKELWVLPKARPPHAGWSRVYEFSWERHGKYWDYFLVKSPPPGAPAMQKVFADAPAGAVEKVSTHGLWSVYKRVQ